METLIADWASLILRWLHIVFGAAWIGTSFYFNWLNNHVRPVVGREPEEGVSGELWSVHGGAFYQVVKYKVAPGVMPATLHWFKYEAYLTWVTGFALLAVVYYLEPNTYLIDPAVMALPWWGAIGIGVGTLVLGFVVYHGLCKSPLGRMPVPFAILGFVLMTAVAFGMTQVFGSRAAYIHVGALIGTIMAWNVFVVIIPNQRVVVDALSKGDEPAAKLGEEAAQRSLHNNYLTLPVLFIMVSNHYPMTFGHEWNWAVLAAISLIGAAVRHWFNLSGQGHKNVWLLPAAAVAMIALALVSAPRVEEYEGEVTFEMVQGIVDRHCVRCHSATPRDWPETPQGVAFDQPEDIVRRATRINAQVVVSRAMPLTDEFHITDEERLILGTWYQRGAVGP